MNSRTSEDVSVSGAVGTELIELFTAEAGSKTDRIDRAYELVSAALPDGTPGAVMLQHADTLIRTARHAVESTAAKTEQAEPERTQQAEPDIPDTRHPLDMLKADADALCSDVMDSIYTGRDGEY